MQGSLASPVALLVNPLLLWGGVALASIPIIIHLLNRRRVRTVRWAAMDWLLAALKRHQRRLRIENWLILFLRCAAVVLLGLALARPVLTDSALAGLFGQKRTIYLVLDTSFSTETKSAARTVFERVKHEAGRVLDTLNKEDAVTVVVTNDPDEDNADGLLPSVLVPRTIGTEGRTRAKEVVAKLRPRHAPANWGDTLDVIRSQMQPEDVNRQLIVISDVQAQDWLPGTRDLAEGSTAAAAEVGGHRVSDQVRALLRQATRVQIVNVGGEERRNLSISNLRAHADRGAFVGRPLSLEIEVSNHGAKPVTGAVVEVFVDGRREPTRTLPVIEGADMALRVPKPGIETIRVDLSRTTFETPGSHEIRVKVGPPAGDPEADGLALDSERMLAVSVRRRIKVVALAYDSRPPQGRSKNLYAALTYLSGIYEGDRPSEAADVTALGSLYTFEAVNMEPQLLNRLRSRETSPIDLVVLCNRPLADANLAEALRDFVRGGGALMVFTGDRFAGSPDAFNEVFHPELPEQRLCPFALGPVDLKRPGEVAWHFDFDRQDSEHPLSEPFTGKDADLWIKRSPPLIRGRTPFVEPPPRPAPDGTTPAPDGGSSDDPPQPEADAGHVVLRFKEDGKPAVVAGTYGEGRTLWIGSSIDTGWMEAHVFPFLPVFLEEGALWLTRPRDSGRNLIVGDVIERLLPPGAEEPRFSIPGGAQVGPSRRTDDERTGRSDISYDTVGVAGMWKLTYGVPEATGSVRKVVDMIAVNPDPAESALAPARNDDIRGDIPPERPLSFHTSYGDTAEEIEEVREGEITRWILWILLGLLVIESVLAWLFGRKRSVAEGAG